MRQLCAVIAACVLLSIPASPQGLTGQISGSVQDTSGAVVPAAALTLVNQGTGQIREMVADSGGAFTFTQLLAGTYTLTVTSAGFKQYKREQISLSSSERAVVPPVNLEVGVVSDSVSVAATAPMLQTQSAERAGTLTALQITQTPVKSRNFLSLLNLMPGVINNNNFEAPGPGGAGGIRINGSRSGSLTITTDGVPNIDSGNQQGPPVQPSMDSIGEIRVLLTNYQAEYGRNSGGSITTITKSGTREFHGGAYYFKRNEALNANDFFRNRDGLKRNIYRYDFPGYFIGGPIIIPKLLKSREKLFFFWSHEHLFRTSPTPLGRATFPTLLERQGDFSQTFDTNNVLIPIRDPLSNQAFPGNIIPPSRISAAGQGLLSLFPVPNTVDPARTFNTVFQGSAKEPHSYKVLRVDWNIGSKSTFYARGFLNTNDRISADWFNQFPVNNTFPLMTGKFQEPAKGIVATLIHTFSPTLVSETTFGVNRYTQLPFQPDQKSLDLADRTKRNIPFPQFFQELNPLNVVPNATFGGVQNAPSINWEQRWIFFGTNTPYTLSHNLSKIYKSHNLKFGAYYEQTSRNAVACCPGYSFMGTANFGRDVNNPLDTNYAFSNAMLGTLTSYTESDKKLDMHGRYYNFEWFAQDNWRVTRRLTLDLGVRFYKIDSTISEGSQLASFERSDFNPALAAGLVQPYQATPGGARVGRNPATGELVPAIAIGTLAQGSGQFFQGMKVFNERIMTGPALVVVPRIGFALDLFGNGKTAVRGGFGMFPGRVPDDQTATHIPQPPLFSNRTLFYTNVADLTSSTPTFSPTNVIGVQHDHDAPTTINFSFGIQQDIGFNTVVDVAYVGSLGRHLQQAQSFNSIPYGTTFQESSRDATTGRPLPLNFLRPYQGYGDIRYNELASSSNYHSMQTTVNRRFSRGFLIGAAWTWSKTMNYVDGNDVINPFVDARAWHYGKAGYDRTHTLVINFDYMLPKASLGWNNRVIRTAFDNWEVSGITTFSSGEPMGFSYTSVNTTDITGGGGLGVDVRVDLVGNPILPKDERTPLRAFRTEAVAMPAASKFGRGNAPKDAFRGPGINNWDVSLIKNFRFGSDGSKNFQFRLETYNTFNHTQFGGASGTGTSVDTVARFDANGNQVNQRFGQYLASRDGRRLQLGIKFAF